MFAPDLIVIQNTKNLLLLSGGPDSVCLFHRLLSQKIPFDCVHFNHHLRHEESDDDQEFVERLCARSQVKLIVGHLFFSQKTGLQNLARQKRLAACFELQAAHSYAYFIAAHHQDDLIETYLMRNRRGAGVKGLASIRKESFFTNPNDSRQTLHLYRPLLDVPKQGILMYLQENGFEFRIDSSNFDKKYLRNKVREDVVAKMSASERRELVEKIKDYQKQDDEIDLRLQTAVEKYGAFVPSSAWLALGEELQFRYFAHYMRKNGFHKQIEKRHFALGCQDKVKLNLNGAVFVKSRAGCHFIHPVS